MQSMSAPRGRTILATTPVDVLADFKAPIQMMQNTTAGDASVIFNGGDPFIVRASETIVFDMPIIGTISTDVDLTVLA